MSSSMRSSMREFPGKPLVIGDLSIPIPIIQGGMGVGISLAGLAAAVSNEGGLGVISAAGMGLLKNGRVENQCLDNVTGVREEIRKARMMTKGALGINIMVALSDFAEIVKAAVEEGIDVIFAGAGLPLSLPLLAGKTGEATEKDQGKTGNSGNNTKLVPIISSAKAVKMIAKWWQEKYNYVPDGFVLEGPLAGGHLGFKKEQLDQPEYQLERLLPEVLEVVREIETRTNKRIPVICAGGIFYGGDIKGFLDMGAAAVQMATRFVATHECDADPAFKQAYVQCRPQDIEIIQSPVGLPGRALHNSFIEQVNLGQKHPVQCPYHCISTCKQKTSPYCISLALINACKGRLGHGFAFIGAKGHLVKEIVSVHQLFTDLAGEYNSCKEQG